MSAYTQYAPNLRKVLKRRGITWKQLVEISNKVIEEETDVKQQAIDFDLLQYLNMEHCLMQGKGKHLFMPDKVFCDWLVACVPVLETEHAKALTVNFLHGNVGCMHFPTSSKLYSCCFVIPEEVHQYNLSSPTEQLIPYGAIAMLFPVNNDSKLSWATTIIIDTIDLTKCEPMVQYYAKLIIGLGMYLSCFPAQIKKGIPEDITNVKCYQQGDLRHIGIERSIVVRDGPMPHYRTGHFKILRSEFYTKMRYKTIFVHGCFVKGKAETVIAKENYTGNAISTTSEESQCPNLTM